MDIIRKPKSLNLWICPYLKYRYRFYGNKPIEYMVEQFLDFLNKLPHIVDKNNVIRKEIILHFPEQSETITIEYDKINKYNVTNQYKDNKINVDNKKDSNLYKFMGWFNETMNGKFNQNGGANNRQSAIKTLANDLESAIRTAQQQKLKNYVSRTDNMIEELPNASIFKAVPKKAEQSYFSRAQSVAPSVASISRRAQSVAPSISKRVQSVAPSVDSISRTVRSVVPKKAEQSNKLNKTQQITARMKGRSTRPVRLQKIDEILNKEYPERINKANPPAKYCQSTVHVVCDSNVMNNYLKYLIDVTKMEQNDQKGGMFLFNKKKPNTLKKMPTNLGSRRTVKNMLTNLGSRRNVKNKKIYIGNTYCWSFETTQNILNDPTVVDFLRQHKRDLSKQQNVNDIIEIVKSNATESISNNLNIILKSIKMGVVRKDNAKDLEKTNNHSLCGKYRIGGGTKRKKRKRKNITLKSFKL